MTQPTLVFRKSELGINIEAIEATHNATFVGDFCVRGKYGWVEAIAALFWQEKPPAEGYSNYFAIVYQQGAFYITSGQSAAVEPITALVARDGEIVYSRHRHDCRTSNDGSVTVDGGRDYLRLVGDYSIQAKQVKLVINGPVIEVHDLVAA